MIKLLTLKPWQLFGLMMGVMIIGSFFGLATNDIVWAFSTFLLAAIYFGWFWAIAVNLNPKLPPTANLNLRRFKLFMLIPMAYIFIISSLLAGISLRAEEGNSDSFVAIIIPLHLFSMYCIFWCMAFVAKSIKAVELQKRVSFGEYAGEFFLIWFFPLGIFILQPRINKMFTASIDNDSKKFLKQQSL
ncbi:hypothetical protein GZH53_01145 [Flavihumibacter sp. R14]|nr:hypothetical protein [Flavihumibacter soli]